LNEGAARRKAATYTGQHKQRTNADIHAPSGIRTQDPSAREFEAVHALDRAATEIGTTTTTVHYIKCELNIGTAEPLFVCLSLRPHASSPKLQANVSVTKFLSECLKYTCTTLYFRAPLRCLVFNVVFFSPEYGMRLFLLNFDTCPPNYTASHRRRY
jgi:hypothetical protein